MKKDIYGPRPAEWMAALGPFTNEHRARRHVFSPEHSALLVIDMQRYFLDESSHRLPPRRHGMLEGERERHRSRVPRALPADHIHQTRSPEGPAWSMGRWWGDVLHDDDELSNIDTDMLPMPDDAVVRKTQYSAFLGTDLDKTLWRMGVPDRSITGVKTHLCCRSTARDAFMYGYGPCSSSSTGLRPIARSSSSRVLRISPMDSATPVTTEEVLSWLRKWKVAMIERFPQGSQPQSTFTEPVWDQS